MILKVGDIVYFKKSELYGPWHIFDVEDLSSPAIITSFHIEPQKDLEIIASSSRDKHILPPLVFEGFWYSKLFCFDITAMDILESL